MNRILFFAVLTASFISSASAAYPPAPSKFEHPRLAHTAGAVGSNSNSGTELSLPTLTDHYGAPGTGVMPHFNLDSRARLYWQAQGHFGYFFDQAMCTWKEALHASPPIPIISFHLELTNGDEIEMEYLPASDKIVLDYAGTNYVLTRQPPITKASLTTTTDAWTYGAHQWTSGSFRISIDYLPVAGLSKVAFTKGADPATGDHGTLKWMVPFRPDPRYQHTWDNLTGDVTTLDPAGEISGSQPEALDGSGLLENSTTAVLDPLDIENVIYQHVTSCRDTSAANGAL